MTPFAKLMSNASSNVIAVALGAIPVLGFVHGFITTSLRKAAKVPYPHSYASIEQCKENVRPSLPPFPSNLTSTNKCAVAGQSRTIQLRPTRPLQLPRERLPDHALHPRRGPEVPRSCDGYCRRVGGVSLVVPVWVCLLGEAAGEGQDAGWVLLVCAGGFVGVECFWGWAGFDPAVDIVVGYGLC